MKRAELLPVFVLCAAVLAVYAALVPPRATDTIWTCNCDEAGYWNLSHGYAAAAPFTWRILHPALAGSLPLDRLSAFRLLTYAWLIGCGLVTYAILRFYRFSPRWSLLGLALLSSLYWLAPYLAWNVYLVDSLAMLFILLATYAALTRNGPLFLAALVFGVMAKESVLFTVPLWLTLATARPHWRHARQAVLLTIPAVITLLIIRTLIHPTNEYSLTGEFSWVIVRRLIHAPTPILDYIPFGILPALALFSPISRPIFKRYALFIALVYVQMLFASDTARLLVIAYMPFLVSGLDGLQTIVQTARRSTIEVKSHETRISPTLH